MSKIDWTRFVIWPQTGTTANSWFRSASHWTIDREQDAFFICLQSGGPFGERPHVYVLYWKNELVRLELTEDWGNGWAAVRWTILKMQIPESLILKRQEIIALVRQAITAHGWNYGSKIPENLDFKLPVD